MPCVAELTPPGPALKLEPATPPAPGAPTALADAPGAPPGIPPPGNPSSLGTMSIKKSNWSDLDNALAMSARESVRRLFESATMKARAVISAMNTGVRVFPVGFDEEI